MFFADRMTRMSKPKTARERMQARTSHPRFSKAETVITALLLGAIITSCSTTPQLLDPEDPTILLRPYTVEQIQSEWQPGLEVLFQQWHAVTGESTDRMYVIEANESGATIEVTTTANHDGRNKVTKFETTWEQLRNHATYSASDATRSEVTIDTPMGPRDCVHYQFIADGRTTDLFFAQDLPGPPVLTEVRKDGELVSSVKQVSRTKKGG